MKPTADINQSTNTPSVLHVSTADSWRGGEQQLAYLFEELEALGVKQAILCRVDSEMEKRCQREGWKHHTAPKAASIDPRFARKLSRISKLEGYDLVHVHDSHAHTFAIMAADLFGLKARVVVSRRVDFPINSKRKYNHSSVAKILCVSDAIKAITGADIVDQSKMVTVHSGIDTKRFEGKSRQGKLHQEFGLDPDTIIVGNISALAPHKDYFTFLDTVKKLESEEKSQKLRYFIVGSGPLEEELKAYATQLGLDNVLIWTGFRKDIPDLLPELDIFLITSETEGLGTTILDAFACGITVVGTAAGGIPELIKDGTTGLLSPVKDSSDLAKNVLRLVDDKALRQKLSMGAEQHLQSFLKSATAAKTLAVYQSLFEEA